MCMQWERRKRFLCREISIGMESFNSEHSTSPVCRHVYRIRSSFFALWFRLVDAVFSDWAFILNWVHSPIGDPIIKNPRISSSLFNVFVLSVETILFIWPNHKIGHNVGTHWTAVYHFDVVAKYKLRTALIISESLCVCVLYVQRIPEIHRK